MARADSLTARSAAGRLCLCGLAAALLAGCATLSARQCRAGDWEAIGRADGERGLEADTLERHREACAGAGVAPDAAAWKAGYQKALAGYCTPRGGYVAGRGGGSDRGVCPAPAEKFREAFRSGLEVERALRELRELRRRADEHELAAMSGEYSADERTALRFRADELNRRARRVEWDVERLDRKYARQYDAPELTWREMR